MIALGDLNDKNLLKPFLWKICGEGKQENEIKKLILDLNLSDMVKLIGKVTDEKKALELHLFSGDVKKYGLTKALNRQNK